MDIAWAKGEKEERQTHKSETRRKKILRKAEEMKTGDKRESRTNYRDVETQEAPGEKYTRAHGHTQTKVCADRVFHTKGAERGSWNEGPDRNIQSTARASEAQVHSCINNNSKHVHGTYYVPDGLLSTLRSSFFNLHHSLWGNTIIITILILIFQVWMLDTEWLSYLMRSHG